MNILILGPYADRLASIISEGTPDIWVRHNDVLREFPNVDWAISFGYPHIISPKVIEEANGRIINLHISYLPHNRGADPNFWSWFDNTPKGVTIHQITQGLDTGPILAQQAIPLSNAHTLKSSYDVLMNAAVALFADKWPAIREHKLKPIPQPKQGTYHRQADKTPWMKNLPGWDATCAEIEKLGERHRAKQSAA